MLRGSQRSELPSCSPRQQRASLHLRDRVTACDFKLAPALLLLIDGGQTLGGEPTAARLWQSLDEDSHQPNAWFLIRDNGGVYEGTIVPMFMKPGEGPNVVCDKCKDDRSAA
jgi:hypothetical protein